MSCALALSVPVVGVLLPRCSPPLHIVSPKVILRVRRASRVLSKLYEHHYAQGQDNYDALDIL